ncbi:MAG: EAL domain-containing protein [Deltaproteobacteria bacterium]|nr:EAL domain-containing protein [Deltaproteobacteria bacterium]
MELLNTITAAADEAPTIEEALRAALAHLCAFMSWEAGRLELTEEAGDLQGRSLWHLTLPGKLHSYRRLAESRRRSGVVGRYTNEASPLWTLLADAEQYGSGIRATFTLPVQVRGRVFAVLEFFAPTPERPDEAVLEVIAFACSELGRILQRKPADDALRRSEREYRMLFEHAHDGVLIIDPQDEIVLDANLRACTIYACTRTDLIGLPLTTLWADPELERRRLHELLLGRGSARYEAIHQRKDGASIVIETSAGPVEFRGRRAVWMANRDVTEKRRVLDALRASEERYRLLFESSPQPMFVYDALTLRFLAVNEAAVRRYGYGRDQLSRMTIAELRSAEDPGTEPALDPMMTEPSVWRHRKADGSIIDVEVTSHEIDFEGRRARLAVANDVTERLRAEEKLWHAAFYDSLTGLPNRALFMERLGQAQARAHGRGAAGYGVLFLDLDRFKFVNDSLGHRAGDALLVQIARRLERLRRAGDTVARLGGDEFAILVEGVKDAEDAARVAERVQRELNLPFIVGPEGSQQEIYSSASIGIALGTLSEQRPEDLLRDADTAMYRAKSQGASQHAVFDITMHDRAVAVLQMESDLRRAIERNALCVQYQPVVTLDTGAITGFEALSRWPHPRRGWISPAEFIPLAEETGLIGPMDRQVLAEACTRLKELQLAHPREVPLTMSVNLSGRELLQSDLVEQVDAILKRTGVDPSSLRLEITETVLVENASAAERSLSRLRALGLKLCIDDFGTGYSSLSYLHRMPIDVLKVDASFVRSMGTDEKNRKIVETIVVLGKNLGVEVVAEGVETEAQAAQLARLGCSTVQGYLFGGPVDLEEAERRLLAQEAARVGAAHVAPKAG